MTAVWLAAGGLIGLANHLMRRWSVSWLGQEMRPNALALVWGGMVLRLALVTLVLVLGLKQGIVPGLMAFAGLWLARCGTVIWHGTIQGGRTKRLPTSSAD